MGCPRIRGLLQQGRGDRGDLAFESHGWVSLRLLVAFLTAFYMTRLFVVVFLNQPMSQAGGNHAHEVPPVMSWPLAILAVPAVFAGWGFVANRFGFGNVHADAVVEHGGSPAADPGAGLSWPWARSCWAQALGFSPVQRAGARPRSASGCCGTSFTSTSSTGGSSRHTQDALAKAQRVGGPLDHRRPGRARASAARSGARDSRCASSRWATCKPTRSSSALACSCWCTWPSSERSSRARPPFFPTRVLCSPALSVKCRSNESLLPLVLLLPLRGRRAGALRRAGAPRPR